MKPGLPTASPSASLIPTGFEDLVRELLHRVVEANVTEPDPLREPGEPAREAVRVERLTVAAFADEIEIRPSGAECQAALRLVGAVLA